VTATDELRRLLDERGVEWWQSANTLGCVFTRWYSPLFGDEVCAMENEKEGLVLFDHYLTPEQAIAATLGSDDTFTREDVEGAFVSGYSLGLDMFDSSKPEKGWNQNKRNMDEEMEDLGWVRKDAATLGAGTCHEVEDEDTGFIVCSECGAVHDTDYTNYYCWCCGRKVVDE